MSLLSAALSRGLEALESVLSESDTPPQFTWDGRTFPCVPTTLGLGYVPTDGGYQADIDLALIVRKDAAATTGSTVFGTTLTVDYDAITVDATTVTADDQRSLPNSGDLITYLATSYRVARRDDRQGHYRLVLESPDR